MFILLAPLCAPAQTTTTTAPTTIPATQAYRERIAKLVEQLEDDDYQIRERATAALIDIGPEVFALLNERLPDGTAELRERAKVILAGVAAKWPGISKEAGPVVGGMQAFLMPPGKSFAPGDKIRLNVLMSNVSPKPRQIIDLRGLDLEMPEARLSFTSPKSDACIIIKKVGETALPKQGQPLVYDALFPLRMQIAPGGNINTRLPIDALVTLAAGEYEVQFIWYANSKALLEGAPDDLKSNIVGLTVQDPK